MISGKMSMLKKKKPCLDNTPDGPTSVSSCDIKVNYLLWKTTMKSMYHLLKQLTFKERRKVNGTNQEIIIDKNKERSVASE